MDSPEKMTINNKLNELEKQNKYDAMMKEKMDQFDRELSKIVGLENFKSQLRLWAKGMLLDQKRRDEGLKVAVRKPHNMALVGGRGTGKTMVARMMGKIFLSLGLRDSDKVVEVRRDNLVEPFHHDTIKKTREKINESRGGILFVDRVDDLLPGWNNTLSPYEDDDNTPANRTSWYAIDYGGSAVKEIASVLQDPDFVVIFTCSRRTANHLFCRHKIDWCGSRTLLFTFDNFTSEDLAEMLIMKMEKLYGLKLDPAFTCKDVTLLMKRYIGRELRNKLNGRLVDLIFHYVQGNADLIMDIRARGDQLSTIEMGDLKEALKLTSRGYYWWWGGYRVARDGTLKAFWDALKKS